MIDTSEILVSKEHIDPLRDQGYVIYKIGRITPVTDGRRSANMLFGNARTLPEAPSDGKIYGRKNRTWVEVSSKPVQVTGITLVAANWSLVSGLYEYDLANSNITANSIVDVIPMNTTIDIAIAAIVLPQTDSTSGSVKLYAKNEPTDDIDVTINIQEKSA